MVVKTRRMAGVAAAIFVAVSAWVPAWSQDQPLWEAGAGVAALAIPDYRGSDQSRTYVLPIPYFVYRGDKLKVDRNGVRSDLAHADGAVLDVSLNLSPPANSNRNEARAGMPSLDPTLEIGPSLRWRLAENDRHDRRLALHLPLRAVITTRFEYIGWVFAPNLNMDFLNLGPGTGWDLGVAVGPLYAAEKYHDYFYEVRPEFATPTRPAYNARGGYSGARLTLSVSKRFGEFWCGAFARYDDLHRAVFEDSPLVRRKQSFMAGVGVSWIFARSEERVQVQDPFASY